MKQIFIPPYLLLALLVSGGTAWPVFAQQIPDVPDTPDGLVAPDHPMPDPAELVGPSFDPVRAGHLAEHYGCTPERIEQMRVEQHMGWGEMEIGLALAQRVAGGLDPAAIGGLDSVLDDILQARSDGMGWGGISQGYELKLGEVVSSAKSGKLRLNPDGSVSADAPERMRSNGKPAGMKPGKPMRQARVNRPDKPQRMHRPDKPVRPMKPARLVKPEKPAKPQRPAKPAKPGRGLGR